MNPLSGQMEEIVIIKNKILLKTSETNSCISKKYKSAGARARTLLQHSRMETGTAAWQL